MWLFQMVGTGKLGPYLRQIQQALPRTDVDGEEREDDPKYLDRGG